MVQKKKNETRDSVLGGALGGAAAGVGLSTHNIRKSKPAVTKAVKSIYKGVRKAGLTKIEARRAVKQGAASGYKRGVAGMGLAFGVSGAVGGYIGAKIREARKKKR